MGIVGVVVLSIIVKLLNVIIFIIGVIIILG